MGNNLFVLSDQDEEETPYEWDGMPEFINEKNEAFKMLKIRFRNEEDYMNFSKIINQKISLKTKAIWYPELDKKANSLLRYFDDK